jgi:hypothetical protein
VTSVTHSPPREPSTYMDEAALKQALKESAQDVAAAFAACQRGALYYEMEHPVVQQQRRDLEAAVRVWQVNAGIDTLFTAAGEVLLLTGHDEGVANDAARNLCRAMISKSVVGFKLKATCTARDLDELIFCLAESDRRLRAAGGVTKLLAERGARGIEVFEMDLDKLLNEASVDPTGLDPLVAKALTEVLALKARDNRRGQAVSLTLEKVDSPETLGSLLDELIDGAAPGVADEQAKDQKGKGKDGKGKDTTSTLAGVNAEELAELCSEAYGKVTAKTQDPEVMAEAAKVLSGALVRLSPMARFKLLQKIAGADKDGAAAEAVGREVPNPMLLSALAQVVMGGERDSKLANAIGGLLERMRPIERERQKILDELDEVARKNGRPLDGLFMQELNEISQKKTFGSLDLPFRETKETLLHSARVRQTTRGQPEIVNRTFSSMRPENKVQRTARLLCGMLEQERTVVPATLASVRGVLTMSATDPVLQGAGGAIILALWNRALRDGPNSPAAKQLSDLATSQNGADWCIALLLQLRTLRGVDTAMLLCDFVKSVLAVHQGESFRRRLVEALHSLDRAVLRVLERRIAEFSPAGVSSLIVRAGRDSANNALGLAQQALRGSNIEVKEAALRSLAPFPDEAVIAFLKRASGAEGDGPSTQALGALKETPQNFFRLQRTAVETLGATRSPAAVPILAELLTRVRLVGGGDWDRMRGIAARALGVNNTREARLVLDEGKRHKQKVVRVACGATS